MNQFNNITIKQYNNKTKGVTLLEVLVVIAIIAILSSVIVFSPRSPSEDLDQTAREFVDNVRLVQNHAMAVAEPTWWPYPVDMDKVDMYGLQLRNSNLYSIWFCDDQTNLFSFLMVNLKNGIIIDPIPNLDIRIKIPDGKMCFGLASCSLVFEDDCFATNEITVTFRKGNLTRTVYITSAGKIEIQ